MNKISKLDVPGINQEPDVLAAAAAKAASFAAWSAERVALVEDALSRFVTPDAPAGLGEAMRYAVLGGGKRLRPLLVLAASEAVLGCPAAALRAACSVELIHAYSLVHDDMPCMDNDVLRRGKPTVHVQFGQARALLAGDALQALAFELLTPEYNAAEPIAPRQQAHLCRLLARAAGHEGMAGGQAIDLAAVGQLGTGEGPQPMSEEALRHMHRCKTGALLRASVMMGVACEESAYQGGVATTDAGGAQAHNKKLHDAFSAYGWAIGLAFQVVDDILDVVGDAATLGKTVGKDAAAAKPTYVSVLGMQRSRDYALELHQAASQALADLRALALPGTAPIPTDTLQALADSVVQRSF